MNPAAHQVLAALEQQLVDLAGIRNATPRDPSFKNWRQATLLLLQRIWPSDQDRQERFRRIPFSPADPRADARTVREWYSRGCQEAARVLNGFIADVHAQGVPVQVADVAQRPGSGEFTVDFPTVDLPSAGFVSSTSLPEEASDVLHLGPSTSTSPTSPVLQHPVHTPSPVPAPSPYATYRPGRPPGTPPAPAPTAAPPAPAPQASTTPSWTPVAPPQPPPANVAPAASSYEARQPKKGMGARLRDLLGFAQLSAKAFTGTSRDQVPERPSAPARLDILPVGDEVMAPRPAAPAVNFAPLQPAVPAAPPALPSVPMPPAASAPAPSAVSPAADVPHEPGASVVMSRPTTLRASIEKVSIESLISPEFRSGAEDPAAASRVDPLAAPHLRPPNPSENAAGAAPAPLEPPVASHAPPVSEPTVPVMSEGTPVLPPVMESIASPQQMVAPQAAAPVAPVAPPMTSAPTAVTTTPYGAFPLPTPSGQLRPPPMTGPPTPSSIIPLPSMPRLPAEPAQGTGEKRSKRDSGSKVIPMRRPISEPPAPPPVAEEQEIDEPAEEMRVDPEEFAQATEDFMRTSPVLGATGRRVKRGYDDGAREVKGFDDPDAIAVAAMADELDGLGVPTARHKEAHARLADLAKRLEKGDLEWAALRKAVWFAMEYPELARRLMPLLLPWIDRAA